MSEVLESFRVMHSYDSTGSLVSLLHSCPVFPELGLHDRIFNLLEEMERQESGEEVMNFMIITFLQM